MGPQPKRFLSDDPQSQPFAGVHISLKQMEGHLGLAAGTLSRTFRGRQQLSITRSEQLATALHMDHLSFVKAFVECVAKAKREQEDRLNDPAEEFRI